ncbi:MAG: cation:proton antiporter [Leptospiraceae bacterium]|nr:cation:proton antiporter [Leptospiraceae bacterium]
MNLNFLAYSLQVPIKDPVVVFTIVLSIILFSPLLLRQFKLPGMIGLILAGVILGPHGTEILERDESIKLFGTVGILYIMFTAGLEIDLHEFSKNKNRIFGFGILSYLIPQLMGFAVAYYFLELSLASSVLFGGLISSHTLLSFPIVTRYRITKNEAATISIGGTIIADIGSLLILAISVNAASGDNNSIFWIKFTLNIAAFVLFTFKILPLFIKWYFKNLESDGVGDYIFVLLIVFLTSFIAELAGMESIIGAFFAGLVLNNFVPKTSPLMNRIHFTGSAIFIPFFLISVGMLVNVKVLFSGFKFWITLLSIIPVVFASKWIPAFIIQKSLGMASEERQLIFGLTVPRAAAALATVLVGYDLDILNQDILYVTIILVLLTSMAGSLITESAGKKIALKEEVKYTRKKDLNERILVPISNPETINHLIDFSISIRNPLSNEPIYPLSVVRDSEKVHSEVASNENKLSGAIERGAASGIPIQILTRIDVNIANGIIRAIKELNITELVIGWNGRPSTKEKLIGSIFDQVLSSYNNLIWVCKFTNSMNSIKRVVIYFPPNSQYELGFFEILENVKQLTGNIGANLTFCGSEDCIHLLQNTIESIKPRIKASFVAINQWKEFFDKNWTTDDLLIFMNAREGTISHSPDLSKMHRMVTKIYKKNNFIIAFPAQNMVKEIEFT